MLDLSHFVTNGREGFAAWEVTGCSNHPDIQHGDIVIGDTWTEPRNGNFVIASVNGLVCIKKFEYNGSRLRLVSANMDYASCEVTPVDRLEVMAVVKWSLTRHG